MFSIKSNTLASTASQETGQETAALQHQTQSNFTADTQTDDRVVVGNTNTSVSLEAEKNISKNQIYAVGNSGASESNWYWSSTALFELLVPACQKAVGMVFSGTSELVSSLVNSLNERPIDEESTSLYRSFHLINMWKDGIQNYRKCFSFLKKSGLNEDLYDKGLNQINGLQKKFENNPILRKNLSDLLFIVNENKGTLKLNRDRLKEFEVSMQDFVSSLDEYKVDWGNLRKTLIDSCSSLNNINPEEFSRGIDFPAVHPEFSAYNPHRINWESDDANSELAQVLDIYTKRDDQKRDFLGLIFWVYLGHDRHHRANSEFRFPKPFEAKLPRIFINLVKGNLPEIKSIAESEVFSAVTHLRDLVIDKKMAHQGCLNTDYPVVQEKYILEPIPEGDESSSMYSKEENTASRYGELEFTKNEVPPESYMKIKSLNETGKTIKELFRRR